MTVLDNANNEVRQLGSCALIDMNDTLQIQALAVQKQKHGITQVKGISEK